MLPINLSFFQYCDNKNGIFSIAPCKVINFNPFWILFGIVFGLFFVTCLDPFGAHPPTLWSSVQILPPFLLSSDVLNFQTSELFQTSEPQGVGSPRPLPTPWPRPGVYTFVSATHEPYCNVLQKLFNKNCVKLSSRLS